MIEAAEANYFEAWRVLAAHAPGGVVEETDALLLTSVPVPVAYFNSAFVKPPADARECLDRVREFYEARGLPYTVRFREKTAGALDYTGVSPLMVAAVASVDTRVDIDVRPVDESNWDDHVDTIAAGFGMPTEVVRGLLSPSLVGSAAYAGFTAYVDGVPASTSALMVSGDVAGVYNVATPEPFRRRGLGEATTRAAIAEGARRGCALTTLQASDMGRPIYERMGYRTVTRWPHFTG